MSTSVGWSEGVDPPEGALQFVELCRALCDPFHYRVAGHDVNGSVKPLRRGQVTVWIFCRIRMMAAGADIWSLVPLECLA